MIKILGFKAEKILKLAQENHNETFSGVVLYDTNTQEITGASHTTGTTNPHTQVTLYRLPAGERGEQIQTLEDFIEDFIQNHEDDVAEQLQTNNIEIPVDEIVTIGY